MFIIIYILIITKTRSLGELLNRKQSYISRMITKMSMMTSSVCMRLPPKFKLNPSSQRMKRMAMSVQSM